MKLTVLLRLLFFWMELLEAGLPIAIYYYSKYIMQVRYSSGGRDTDGSGEDVLLAVFAAIVGLLPARFDCPFVSVDFVDVLV